MEETRLGLGAFRNVAAASMFAAACLLAAAPASAGKAPKVEICHIPPGNPANAHTIQVSGNAIKAHLKHGDYLGPCGLSCQDLCEDNNACTEDDCVAGECIHTTVSCNDLNECTADACNPATGCEYTAMPGAPCTGQDPSACTLDTGLCNEAADCVLTPILDCCEDNSECADGDLCTIESCVGNECTEPVLVDCVAPDACFQSGCDPATGQCVDLPVVCAPAGPCETLSLDCDVDPGESPCIYAPIPGCCDINDPNPDQCDDGDPCTGDACFNFECVHEDCHDPVSVCEEFTTCDELCNPITTPVNCEDGDLCTDNVCDEDAGGCVQTATDCNDGDACTAESCDPATGCAHTPVGCDDGSACTVDSCDPATGCANTPVGCDDFDACTDDSCDPATGCVNDPIACDDSNVCTTNACDPASGCVFTPIPNCCVADADCPPGDFCNAQGFCETPAVECPCFTAEMLEYNRPTWTGSGGSCYVGGTVAPGGVALFGTTGYQTQARAHLRSNPALGGANDIYCYKQMRNVGATTGSTLSGWGTPPGAGQVQITNDEWNACVDLVEAEIALVGLTCN